VRGESSRPRTVQPEHLNERRCLTSVERDPVPTLAAQIRVAHVLQNSPVALDGERRGDVVLVAGEEATPPGGTAQGGSAGSTPPRRARVRGGRRRACAPTPLQPGDDDPHRETCTICRSSASPLGVTVAGHEPPMGAIGHDALVATVIVRRSRQAR